ncbi:MAG: putative signal transduction protein [Rhodobacteraceae bacterium HLUCCA08]|nr:MAG: putative signal transduction protein [Rhodobacteraceae bacterium HLUCCA08]
MLVQQILGDKAIGGIVMLTSSDTVADAARLMSEKRIGTVVISDDGGKTPHGILSERDIVRELGAAGPGCLSRKVGEMMTRNPKTCVPADHSVKILSTMTEGRFRHMPVMQDGALIGLVSIGDVVKGRLSELAAERDALQGMIMGY